MSNTTLHTTVERLLSHTGASTGSKLQFSHITTRGRQVQARGACSHSCTRLGSRSQGKISYTLGKDPAPGKQRKKPRQNWVDRMRCLGRGGAWPMGRGYKWRVGVCGEGSSRGWGVTGSPFRGSLGSGAPVAKGSGAGPCAHTWPPCPLSCPHWPSYSGQVSKPSHFTRKRKLNVTAVAQGPAHVTPCLMVGAAADTMVLDLAGRTGTPDHP